MNYNKSCVFFERKNRWELKFNLTSGKVEVNAIFAHKNKIKFFTGRKVEVWI